MKHVTIDDVFAAEVGWVLLLSGLTQLILLAIAIVRRIGLGSQPGTCSLACSALLALAIVVAGEWLLLLPLD